MKKILINVIVMICLWLNGCIKGSSDGIIFNTPDISLNSLKPTGFKDGKLNFDIGLKVKNNNKYIIDLTSLISQIELNGIVFLQAQNNNEFEPIQANSEGVIILNSQLDGAAFKKFISTFNWRTIDYKINADVGVNRMFKVPVNKQGTFDIHQSIKSFLPFIGNTAI